MSARRIAGTMVEVDGLPLFLSPGATVRLDLEPGYALRLIDKDTVEVVEVVKIHRCARTG